MCVFFWKKNSKKISEKKASKTSLIKAKKTNKKPDVKKVVKKNPFIAKEAPTGRIIRILQTDIPGNRNIYTGLTRIKGVSWAISNAVCILNKFDKKYINAYT